MDDGKGNFLQAMSTDEKERLEKLFPNHGGWFRVGEEVKLKGSLFRVKRVKPHEITLRLLPKKAG